MDSAEILSPIKDNKAVGGNLKCGGGLYSLGIQSPCQMMIHLLSKVFRYHYHSHKVIGSLQTMIFVVVEKGYSIVFLLVPPHFFVCYSSLCIYES